MDDYFSTILLFICLMAFSAFFSASETALTGANRIRLKNLTEQGSKKAKTALGLIENYDTSLSTLLIGNNIVNTLGAAISTVLCNKLFGAGGTFIATFVVTIMIIVFGEVMPKTFANANSEKVIQIAAPVLRVMKIIFTPFVAVLEALKKLLMRGNKHNDEVSVTEEELRVIIEEIEDEGVIEEEQSELLQSALEFSDIVVDEILTPRVDIFAVSVDSPREEILDVFFQQSFSRLPVYDKNIDNIIGVLNQKDYFTAIIKGEEINTRAIMQPCLYVPPKKHIAELMTELQHKKLHMAIVTDQYGGTLGLVTLEDILEELVGEIWDEHDEITYMILPLDDGIYEVSGELPVEDLYENLSPDVTVPVISSSTVAGLALEHLGHIPKQGEGFTNGDFEFVVTKVDEQRILKLSAKALSDKKPDMH